MRAVSSRHCLREFSAIINDSSWLQCQNEGNFVLNGLDVFKCRYLGKNPSHQSDDQANILLIWSTFTFSSIDGQYLYCGVSAAEYREWRQPSVSYNLQARVLNEDLFNLFSGSNDPASAQPVDPRFCVATKRSNFERLGFQIR